jgi:DNA polymerase I
MRTLIVDGDMVVFKVAIANEYPVCWGDDLWTLHSNADEVTQGVMTQIESVKANLSCDQVVVAFSSPNLYRTKVDGGYKANRAKNRKPLAYKACKHFLVEESSYTVHEIEGLEADDVLGIMGTNPKYPDRVIWSGDKDLKQIPGELYNGSTVSKVAKEDADLWFFQQTLMGDPVDGYSGCPGIGEKKATDLLSPLIGDLTAMWQKVVETYATKGLGQEVAIRNARLARILRYGEYDFKTKKPLLFHPTCCV